MDHNISTATSSLVSTSSNFSSPETSDWSKAEQLTFLPKSAVPRPSPEDSQRSDGTTHYVLAQPPSQGRWINSILEQERMNSAARGHRPSRTLNMRNLWEQRIYEEIALKEQEDAVSATLCNRRQFLFPKWRSVDPMTASLVASTNTNEVIPRDSRIPMHRHQQLAQTEKAAQYDRLELHKPYLEMQICKEHQRQQRRLFVSRSEVLNAEQEVRRKAMEMHQTQKPQWFDPEEIRQMVSHESIANVNATRQMFERGTGDKETLEPKQQKYDGRLMVDEHSNRVYKF